MSEGLGRWIAYNLEKALAYNLCHIVRLRCALPEIDNEIDHEEPLAAAA